MHMKKHQIEQFNRQKDYEDRTIDETVSQLVKNILREGKEKEKKNIGTVACGTTHPPIRRKRSFHFQNSLRKGGYKSERCSDAKKMSNSNLFPTLSPMLLRSESNEGMVSPNDTRQEYECGGDEVITIKIEPNDIDEYGGAEAVHVDSTEESSQDYVTYVENDCSNKDRTSSENDQRSLNVTNKIDIINIQSNGCLDKSVEESENCETSADDANDKIENRDIEIMTAKEEDELSLPMVEEFYQNRDKSFEDVKVTAKDKGSDRQRSPKENCKSLLFN